MGIGDLTDVCGLFFGLPTTWYACLQVFNAAERDRQAGCKARHEALVRGLLLRQERSRELFARKQGGLFEGALDKVRL